MPPKEHGKSLVKTIEFQLKLKNTQGELKTVGEFDKKTVAQDGAGSVVMHITFKGTNGYEEVQEVPATELWNNCTFELDTKVVSVTGKSGPTMGKKRKADQISSDSQEWSDAELAQADRAQLVQEALRLRAKNVKLEEELKQSIQNTSDALEICSSVPLLRKTDPMISGFTTDDV